MRSPARCREDVAVSSQVCELPLQGDDAQGGAGIKAVITVAYARPCASLHNRLFVKMPWPLEGRDANATWRYMLSSMYGDGDGYAICTSE